MASPLQSAVLRRIIFAYTVNRLGSWIGLVALMVAVYDHTHSALAVAALLLAWQALPAFVVPALVARVESSKRRGELSGLYLFEALATGTLAVLLWHFSLPAILLIAALDGTAALTASALLRTEVARVAREQAREAAGPQSRDQVSDARLHEAERRANAALNVAFAATFAVSPALAGAIVAGLGASAGLFVDVGSFLFCGALLLDLHPYVEEAGGDSVRARLSAAWEHVNALPSLRLLLAVEAVALLFFESGGPIEVAFVKGTLGAGSGGFGLLLATWGAGGILGSIIFARSVHRPLGLMLSAGALAIGLAYIGFSIAPTLALACPAALLGGIGNGLQWPSLISLVQRLTPPHLHGRLMGGVESLGAICLAGGLLLGGGLTAASSPRAAFLIVGLGAALSTVAFLTLTMRGLEPASQVDPVADRAPDAVSEPPAETVGDARDRTAEHTGS